MNLLCKGCKSSIAFHNIKCALFVLIDTVVRKFLDAFCHVNTLGDTQKTPLNKFKENLFGDTKLINAYKKDQPFVKVCIMSPYSI